MAVHPNATPGDQSIRVAYWNMNGFESNKDFIEHLMKEFNCDIIALSEHKLYPCNEDKLQTYFGGDYTCAVTCSADLKSENFGRIFGHAGVAICWKSDLTASRRSSPSDRITICELRLKDSQGKVGASVFFLSVYLPPVNSKLAKFEEVLAVLEELIMELKEKGHVCIIGDMNAQLGHEAGPRGSTWSKQGRSLFEMVTRCGLCVVDLSEKASGPCETYRKDGIGKSYVDHCLVDVKFLRYVKSVKVMDDCPDNFSDHMPTLLDIDLPNCFRGVETSVDVRRTSWKKLSRNDINTKYTQPLEQCLNGIAKDFNIDLERAEGNLSPQEVDECFSKISHAMTSIAGENLPSSKYRPHVKPYWSKELTRLRDEAKYAWKVWTSEGRPELSASRQDYKSKKSIYRTALRKAQHMQDVKDIQDICYNSDLNQASFWKLVNRRRRKSRGPKCMTLKVNKIIIDDPKEILSVWRDHFSHLATPAECSDYDSGHKDYVESCVRDMESDSLNNTCPFLSQPITIDEVKDACRILKAGKKGGLDGCNPEHYKHGGNILCIILVTLFNCIVKLEYIPNCFRTAIEVPVFKGGLKDPLSVDGYRKVSLMTINSKLMEHIIAKRTEWWFTSDRLGALQGAAVKKCSNLHTSLLLQESVAYFRDRGQHMLVAFLDTQKAFDTVWHEGLFYKLFKAGLNGKLWRLLRSWYKVSRSVVWVAGQHSSSFPVAQGVRQGGVLSMKLYQLYISDLLKSLESETLGCCLYGIFSGSPCYADDLALIAPYPGLLQEMLNKVLCYSRVWRYQFNATKSELLRTSRQDRSVLKLGNTAIDSEREVTHVGIPLSTTGQIGPEAVDARIGKGRRSFFGLHGVNPHGRFIPPSLYSLLYWAVCIPSMLYGCEVIVFSDSSLELFEQFHRFVGRRLQRLPETCANVVAIASLGWWTISGYIDKCKLIFGRKLLNCGSGLYQWIVIHKLNEIRFVKKDKPCVSPLRDIYGVFVKYGLHTQLHEWLDTGVLPPLNSWKRTVTEYVTVKEYSVWRATCLQYRSCTLFNRVCSSIKRCVWWDIAKENADLSQCCWVAFRLLTRENCLMMNRGKYKGLRREQRICPLCERELEDEGHFLWRCMSLGRQRDWLRSALRGVLQPAYGPFMWSSEDQRTAIVLGEPNCINADLHRQLLVAVAKPLYRMYRARSLATPAS